MRHLRLLAPIDDPKQNWFLASDTSVFAASTDGLAHAKSYAETKFSVDYQDAPAEIVLCTGDIKPGGTYATIRRVERGIDLIDEWAPIGSAVPDPSLSELKSKRDSLEEQTDVSDKDADERSGENDEAARWQMQQIQDDIYRIEASLTEIEESQRHLWGDCYPSKYPEEVNAV